MSEPITFASVTTGGLVDLRRLRYFVAVAEERHFGRAAGRLHVTTPPLSQRIRELEQALGLELFERTSRHVVLTPAGERLLPEAREVLQAMDRFSSVASDLAPSAPTCVVGYCHGSEGGVMRMIKAFRAIRPDVALRADGLTSLRILDGLRSGSFAAGIVRGPVIEPGTLTSAPLARVPVDHVAVPPGHHLATVDVVDVGALADEPVLIVDREDAPTAHDAIEAFCAAAGARPRWISHAAIQVERVLDQVALGTGIGWLNAWQAGPAARRTDVAVRPLRPVSLYDEFCLVWRASDTSSTTAEFVETALAAFES